MVGAGWVGGTYLGGYMVGTGWVVQGTSYQGRVFGQPAALAVLAGLAVPARVPTLAPAESQSQTGYTNTARVQSVRVEKHERGGPAKGVLIYTESKSTRTISYAFSLEELTPFDYRCFSR